MEDEKSPTAKDDDEDDDEEEVEIIDSATGVTIVNRICGMSV
jgi:hypothetical protein